jgi:hypothetical protein
MVDRIKREPTEDFSCGILEWRNQHTMHARLKRSVPDCEPLISNKRQRQDNHNFEITCRPEETLFMRNKYSRPIGPYGRRQLTFRICYCHRNGFNLMQDIHIPSRYDGIFVVRIILLDTEWWQEYGTWKCIHTSRALRNLASMLRSLDIQKYKSNGYAQVTTPDGDTIDLPSRDISTILVTSRQAFTLQKVWTPLLFKKVVNSRRDKASCRALIQTNQVQMNQVKINCIQKNHIPTHQIQVDQIEPDEITPPPTPDYIRILSWLDCVD